MSLFKIINYFIALVWFINGLFCKILNLVPRHQEIVQQILNTTHATVLTKGIGLSEIFMAAWILSGIARKLNAWTQVIIIAAMNTMEFLLVPHLLLWGRLNAFFACLLILLILFNEYYLHKNLQKNIDAGIS